MLNTTMYKDGITVFSGFDGISCGQLGLIGAGILYNRYIASELLFLETRKGKLIPNPVIDIVKYHHPETEFIGDITKVDGYQFRNKINVALFGSPCQSFSDAGNREGFDGKSGLFWHVPRLIDEMSPEYFFLENVMMKDKWIHIISDALGVEPIFIDSAIASAQTRPRLYWTDIPYTPIEDRHILLSDVIIGAVTGASKHGKPNPLFGIVRGETKWKNQGWEFNPHYKSRCMVTTAGHYKDMMGNIRKLTPEHSEILQTIPVGYTGVTGLCDTKRYHAIGNAWTVDVIVEAFFKNLPWANKSKVQPIEKFLNL